MTRRFPTHLPHFFMWCLLCALPGSICPPPAGAQQAAATADQQSTPVPLDSLRPLPANVEPFAALEQERATGKVIKLKFKRTKLDQKAQASAQVAVRGETLLVRVQAQNMPLPSIFGVPRYALWVSVSNYQVKLYIGDLPIQLTSKSRGTSNSAYRFVGWPRDAVVGGLLVTAEPIRYSPIVNEALRPLLVALIPQEDSATADAPAVYEEPPPLVKGEPPRK